VIPRGGETGRRKRERGWPWDTKSDRSMGLWDALSQHGDRA
jgi:hypothetical protein